MKKTLFIILLLSSMVYANTQLSYEYGNKDYNNSMTKIDGKVQNINYKYFDKKQELNLSMQSDNVNRKHSITNVSLPSLDVEKYSAKYSYNLNNVLALKGSFIKIIDNLAPTDQGKIYGVGATYNISKALISSINYYKSDYKDFDVNQYDISLSKAFKINDLKLKATILAKKIDIDGNKYGAYTFKDRDYFTTGLKLAGNYNGFITGFATFFGERIFTVLDDGMKVQHHAMQQDKTYMFSFGKKFKNFDIIAKYSYQNGKELPENRDDVDTKVTSILFSYKF
jgi:hypothetical protein